MLILFDQSTLVPIRPFLTRLETQSGVKPPHSKSRNNLPANVVLGFETEAVAKIAAGSSRKRRQGALAKKAAPRRRTPKRANLNPLIWSAAA